MKKYAFLVLSIALFAACKSHQTVDHQKAQAKLDSVDNSYKKNLMDYNLYVRAAETLDKYSHDYPNDTMSPQYERRAAEIYLTVNKLDESIKLLTDVQARFPTTREAAHSLFLKAFIYDSQLKNTEKARQYYQEFLDKYPNSPMASTAEASIQNLGKSPEELVKQFEHKNDSIAHKQPASK